MEIPDDLDCTLHEIDEELKAKKVAPHARPIHAIMAFGRRIKISIPLVPVPHDAGAELFAANKYCEAIHAWYEEHYGDRLKTDPSAARRVAVLADGDIWELRLPVLMGTARLAAERELNPNKKGYEIARGGVDLNVCEHLSGITAARLKHFTDADLAEVLHQFCAGMDACAAIIAFAKKNHLYAQCPGDLATAVTLLTAQVSNYGQSRYASSMLAERFMKGMIMALGRGQPEKIHRLKDLHSEITAVVQHFDISSLLTDIECKPAVRYGEEPSTREQAYAAHRASLIAARILGSIEVFPAA